MAQLTVRSLSIPEDPGSNPVIGNFYWTYLLLTVSRKDEYKEMVRLKNEMASDGPYLFEKQFPDSPEPVVRHVNHLTGRVEPPLEVDVRLRIGNDLARDPRRLLAGHPEHLNLVRLAIGGN